MIEAGEGDLHSASEQLEVDIHMVDMHMVDMHIHIDSSDCCKATEAALQDLSCRLQLEHSLRLSAELRVEQLEAQAERLMMQVVQLVAAAQEQRQLHAEGRTSPTRVDCSSRRGGNGVMELKELTCTPQQYSEVDMQEVGRDTMLAPGTPTQTSLTAVRQRPAAAPAADPAHAPRDSMSSKRTRSDTTTPSVGAASNPAQQSSDATALPADAVPGTPTGSGSRASDAYAPTEAAGTPALSLPDRTRLNIQRAVEQLLQQVNGPTVPGELIQRGAYGSVSRAVVAGQEVAVKASRLGRLPSMDPEAWEQDPQVKVRAGEGGEGGKCGGGHGAGRCGGGIWGTGYLKRFSYIQRDIQRDFVEVFVRIWILFCCRLRGRLEADAGCGVGFSGGAYGTRRRSHQLHVLLLLAPPFTRLSPRLFPRSGCAERRGHEPRAEPPQPAVVPRP